jgi:hypothetical protein
MGVGAIALHHDAADDAAGAQQRRPQPVFATGTEQHETVTELLLQFLERAHQRAAFLQQVPGQAVQHVVQRQALVRRGRVGIGDVDVIGEADGVGGGVVQHDVEVFRVHQAADDGMQRAHHLGHVVFGAGLFGDRVQRALQPFGQRQARDRLVQAAGFGQLAQADVGQPAQPVQAVAHDLGQRQVGPFEHQGARALRILGQFHLPGQRSGLLVHASPTQAAMDAEIAQHEFADFHHAGGVGRFEQPFDRRVQGRKIPSHRRWLG